MSASALAERSPRVIQPYFDLHKPNLLIDIVLNSFDTLDTLTKLLQKVKTFLNCIEALGTMGSVIRAKACAHRALDGIHPRDREIGALTFGKHNDKILIYRKTGE
jgi:chemotaxis response regulator CheB